MESVPTNISVGHPMNQIIKDFDIDITKGTYIGVWSGDKSIISLSDDLSASVNLGVDGGRGTVPCSIDIGTSKLLIGKRNYYMKDADIQVLVFDNNYQKVIDNVAIDTDLEGNVKLHRE